MKTEHQIIIGLLSVSILLAFVKYHRCVCVENKLNTEYVLPDFNKPMSDERPSYAPKLG